MPPSRFSSFQQTPILFSTVSVSCGLPLLSGDTVQAILRDVWLQATVCDRWFVGEYWILPDRVSLFVSPGRAAGAQGRWETRWRSISAFRINAATGGSGQVWAEAAPPLAMITESDYESKCEAMRTESSSWLDPNLAVGRGGMIWQLLPDAMRAGTAPVGLRGVSRS